MKIGAIILTWEDVEHLRRATRSVEKDVWRTYVVDNGSSQAIVRELRDLCRESGHELIANNENLGYGKGNNVGIARALADGCDALLIMNNDAIARPGAVRALAEHLARHSRVAAVGPTVVGIPSGLVLHTDSVMELETGRVKWQDSGARLEEIDRQPRQSGYLSGEAFLARADVFRRHGAFDPRFHSYFEDAEWSVRVRRAGWRLDVVPDAVFDHVWGGTMPSLAGAYHRAHSRPLFLAWGLGKSWRSAARLSLRPTVQAMLPFLKRAQLGLVVRGILLGWISGLVRLIREPGCPGRRG